MPDNPRYSLAKLTNFIQERLSPAAVLIYLGIVLVCFTLLPVYYLSTRHALLQTTPALDLVGNFVIPYLIGLVYLVCGLYVYGVRRSEIVGLEYSVFASSAALVFAALFGSFTTYYIMVMWVIAVAVMGGAHLNLALLFPESVRLVARYPLLRWIGYLFAAILIVVALPTISDYDYPIEHVLVWRYEYIFAGAAVLFFLVMVGARQLTASSPIVRGQARLVFWGTLLSILPLMAWFALKSIWPSLAFSALYLLPLAVFPVVTVYAILRYRLYSTDYLLSRTVLYTLLTTLAVVGYALIVGGLSLIFGPALQATNPIIIGLMVFLLALGFNPLRNYLQRTIDKAFFRGQIAYQDRLQAFGRELTQALGMPQITNLLHDYIDGALLPSRLYIFLYETFSGHYVAASDQNGRETSDVRIPLNSALVQSLESKTGSLFLNNFDDLTGALQAEQARLALLGVQCFVPMPGRQQLIGWLALGDRRSGDLYTSRDLEFLEALSGQAALAIERAQVVVDLERRIQEMNVLTRVAQGVSFTVAFDDILELIYAQTNQLLPTRDFRITLYDDDVGAIFHVFYLENDDRLEQKENQFMPIGQGLDGEVVNSQQALLCDDYERKCRGLGLLPSQSNIYAWIGVPLNAGAKTIGVISLGSRDPTVIYTNDQRDLLQAIADQASGAIVKARLLQESEQRAHQLASLNEIAVGLTSTLDIKPLLNQILDSATDILNCEAGSLFLVDEDTRELVFEVVMGPVADDLLGQRLAPGTGLVGESVDHAKAIIANDAKRRKEWHDTDEETGFDTQDLLVVPMRIQDRVIGVIEVINKANGAPFTKADQDLLTAFTSQATIAVEAMKITLDWAMRQSKADAGLVGVAEEDAVFVMTAKGYGDELAGYLPAPEGNGNYNSLDLEELPAMSETISSGQPNCLLAREQTGDGAFGLLKETRMQVYIPIRRESHTIGVLLLESKQGEACPEEMINFLVRLSDHAAIAIANAQLYDEVLEANQAKSRFVSFVAHELKNPMASIKGYTELVAGGMAGPVTDMQTSFLDTVRSNVDRMDTIVSDLNDLTKIQVGILSLEYHPIQIKDTLDEVVRSLNRQIEEKEQQMELELPEDLAPVWADPARLAQILTNIVSNATKYTPNGGIFGIKAESYTEEDQPGVDFVHIWVMDSGIGISEEDQEKIFQQYFRTDSAKEMASGTGLGLNITKSLIEMQGGRIWFESVFGQGTTFHFTLPVAETQ